MFYLVVDVDNMFNTPLNTIIVTDETFDVSGLSITLIAILSIFSYFSEIFLFVVISKHSTQGNDNYKKLLMCLMVLESLNYFYYGILLNYRKLYNFNGIIVVSGLLSYIPYGCFIALSGLHFINVQTGFATIALLFYRWHVLQFNKDLLGKHLKKLFFTFALLSIILGCYFSYYAWVCLKPIKVSIFTLFFKNIFRIIQI